LQCGWDELAAVLIVMLLFWMRNARSAAMRCWAQA
jgi:hypothetical protein